MENNIKGKEILKDNKRKNTNKNKYRSAFLLTVDGIFALITLLIVLYIITNQTFQVPSTRGIYLKQISLDTFKILEDTGKIALAIELNNSAVREVFNDLPANSCMQLTIEHVASGNRTIILRPGCAIFKNELQISSRIVIHNSQIYLAQLESWYSNGTTIIVNPPPPPPPPSAPPQCSDSADNDGDSLIDYPNDPGCTSASDDDEFNAPPPSFDFTVSVFPASGSVSKGNSISTTVTVTLTSGTPQSVSLTQTGCPPSSTCGFVPSSGTPTYASTFAVVTTNPTPTGVYPIIIRGTSGAIIKNATYTLTVTT